MSGVNWTEEEYAAKLAERGNPFYTKETGWTPEGIAEMAHRAKPQHCGCPPNGHVSGCKVVFPATKKAHKYGAKRKEVDGIGFDSTAEANAYIKLRALEKSEEIHTLTTQPRFVLQEAFTDKEGRKHRAIEYRADFSFIKFGPCSRRIVVDVKGMATEAFKIKWKLAIARYPEVLFRQWTKDSQEI
jgi:hypothetical protein